MRNLELPGRSPVHAPEAMVCTSHALSSHAAIEVLRSGGNALDAAVAACAVQCVVEPESTGLGGDCFCLYSKEGTDEIIGYNGSGSAPKAISIDVLKAQGIDELKRSSPHSVTLPGAVEAWGRLIDDHGNKDLGELLQPAIRYARDGYPISSRVHSDFLLAENILRSEESTAKVFLPGGAVPSVGQMHSQPQLASTLQAIADHGPNEFYSGEIASDIVNYLQCKGGLHTLEDFASVKGEYVDPISTKFHDHCIWQCPPNGQGVIALLLLNIAEELERCGSDPITADRLHFELEACRAAYSIRNIYLADPKFCDVPVERLLSRSYAKSIRDAINPDQVSKAIVDVELPCHEDTVYITVVDRDRNACSFINSLFMEFGTGLTAPQSGIVLQNRGMGFSLDQNSPNCLVGGKRPLHTLIPGMVTKDGRGAMSFGVMGGQYQAFGHMQFLTRFFNYNLDIQEAMDRPRAMVNLATGLVEIEGAVTKALKDELRRRGHRLVSPAKPIGGSQAIWIDWEQNVLTGGLDPRKDGCAIGY